MLNIKKPIDDKLGTQIVPLIDIIFVTLIFFLVLYRYSTFEVSNGLENMDRITKGNLAQSYDIDNTVFVQVDLDGVVFVNDVQVENTESGILARIDDPPSKCVVLILDDNAAYDSYGELIQNLKNIGLNKIVLIE